MAIGRISGSVLKSNLTRNGVDLAFETNLLYLDVTNSRVGIGTSEPSTALHVNGTITASGLTGVSDLVVKRNDSAVDPQLLIEQDGTGDATLGFKFTDGNALSMGLNNSNGDMFVISYNGTDVGAGTSAFTINSSSRVGIHKTATGGGSAVFQVGAEASFDANVGIGTTSPSTELDVNGTITATALAGATATLTNTTTGDSLLLTTTEDSSSAAPVITLKRNSGSPADADYLGQIKFKGENDADQEVVYAKITGKIQDASDGTEDGLIEFANKKAGSNVITARLRSDSLQLLNGTSLTVAGDATVTGSLIADGLSYPTADGTNGQVLTTDGSGNLSFTSISIGDLDIVGSTISSPSNADLTLATAGSGTVIINGLSFPTGDGSANQVLATDGSGQLSFVDSGAADTDSDEAGAGTGSSDISTGTSVINSFNVSTFDSAFYFLVTRDDVNNKLDLRRHSLTHDDTTAVVNTFGQVKSDNDNSYITVDADVNSNLARLNATGQSVSNSVSLYRIVLGQSTTNSTSGNTAFVVNTDVDSAVENIDTWSASTYRGAQYFISATNATTGEASNMEALVVTDGTSAFITAYGNVNTGNNDLIELTADVSGGNVRLRASGRTPNTRVAMYRILLGDSESSSAGSSVNVIGATTVSSASTTLDTFSSDDYHGAMYLVVGHNGTEGASSVQTVYMLNDGTDAFVSTGPTVSSKGTDQLTFTGSFSGGTATLSCASTSGASTTVNAYRIHLQRGVSNTMTTDTAQTVTGAKTFTSVLSATSIKDTVNSLSAAASVALDPTTGGIQTITLGQATTFTLSNWASGHRMTLMIDDGSNYAVTWPTMQWAGGVAPTLATSGFNTIELWYVGSTLYGAYVGAHS